MERTIVGTLGEDLVERELARRGWTAARTPINARAFDIIAEKDGRTIRVRVKTKKDGVRKFQWGAKKTGEIFLDRTNRDFVVMVSLNGDGRRPDYFVAPTAEVERHLIIGTERYVRRRFGDAPPERVTWHNRNMYVSNKGQPEQTEFMAGCREAWQVLETP